MAAVNDLEKVLQMQIDLAEALIVNLRQQREALVNGGRGLSSLVEQGEGLVRPINALEAERITIAKTIMQDVAPEKGVAGGTLSDLVDLLSESDARRINAMGKRLRNAAEVVLRLSRENRPVIDHSLKFVRENIKILTENFSRQLIDQKM